MDVLEPMPCSISRFHSAYFGLVTLLTTELKFGGRQAVDGAAALKAARFPPVENAFRKAVLQPETMVAALPGNPGARIIPPFGFSKKLLLCGEFRAKVSNSNPG